MSEIKNYTFKSKETLEIALTHKSYGNENRAELPIAVRDNERLEFLGDAVLDLVISEMLLEHYSELPEGDLSKLRASLVNETVLAGIARDLKLGEILKLGKGEEQTGGRDKDSILSSTLEAVIAAIYLDSGYKEANSWLRGIFKKAVKRSTTVAAYGDFKTKLQEVVQAKFKTSPRYDVLQSYGPDHDKTFEIALIVNNDKVATGQGKSKKEAEQSAAKIALEIYDEEADE